MLPTLAKIVGAPMPTDRVIDGRDITALMFDDDPNPVRKTHVCFTGAGAVGAIRQGDWKIIHGANWIAKGNKGEVPADTE